MPPVRIADRRLWVGDQSRALLSGEVHYWRLDPAVWPAVLERAQELGLDVLSTYVCWDFHEVRPGQFDLVGETHPQRNLLAFLGLVKQRGFWLLIRPGPYIYAEWRNSGIPDRMVQWHRLHPTFQAEAARWMAAVVEAIRPHLATNGGPIVMLQADNEADPWQDVYGQQLGLEASPGLFQHFLRQRYTHIAELNRAWSSDYGDFEEARAVLSSAYEPFIPRYLDTVRFRHWYATEIVRWTTEEYRRLGVDVPIYANTYIGTAVQDWRAIESVCDLAGPDIYPTNRLADKPDEHRALLDAVRYAHSYSRLPFIPEFESGIWHGWHRAVGTLEATHYELNAVAALQAGIAGWSWYMLASRDNWYMSPITERGRFRPEVSPAFAELVTLFRALDPPSLTRITDTAVTFSALERGAGVDDAGRDVLGALHAADIDYDLFELETRRIAAPLLFYAGGRWLEPRHLRQLEAYLEGGGTLVCFQPPANLLEIGDPDAISSAAAPQRLRLALGQQTIELSSRAVFLYPGRSAEPLVAERSEPLPPTQEGGHLHLRLPMGERLTVGYVEPRGPGRLVVLGIAPTPELMVAVHSWLGVRVPCRAGASGGRIHSSVSRRGGERFLIVTNTSAEPRDVRLALDLGKDAALRSARDLRTGGEVPVRAHDVTISVPARSGTAVRLS
jgi:glycosyl hydrolase family 35